MICLKVFVINIIQYIIIHVDKNTGVLACCHTNCGVSVEAVISVLYLIMLFFCLFDYSLSIDLIFVIYLSTVLVRIFMQFSFCFYYFIIHYIFIFDVTLFNTSEAMRSCSQSVHKIILLLCHVLTFLPVI